MSCFWMPLCLPWILVQLWLLQLFIGLVPVSHSAAPTKHPPACSCVHSHAIKAFQLSPSLWLQANA